MANLIYAVVSDITPNRATVESLHDDYDDATISADDGEMCQVLLVPDHTVVGERVWHNGDWTRHPAREVEEDDQDTILQRIRDRELEEG